MLWIFPTFALQSGQADGVIFSLIFLIKITWIGRHNNLSKATNSRLNATLFKELTNPVRPVPPKQSALPANALGAHSFVNNYLVSDSFLEFRCHGVFVLMYIKFLKLIIHHYTFFANTLYGVNSQNSLRNPSCQSWVFPLHTLPSSLDFQPQEISKNFSDFVLTQ
jgi:hypothetical protein